MSSSSSSSPSAIELKLVQAGKYKDTGNTLFKEGKYKRAISKYSTVMAFTTGLPGSKRGLHEGMAQVASQNSLSKSVTFEEEACAVELEKTAHQNIATCYLKLNDPRKAIEHCNKAIALDASAWKAYIRKGEAYGLCKDVDACREALAMAAALTDDASAHATITRETQKITLIEKAQLKKQKQSFANIFTRSLNLSQEENCTTTTCTTAGSDDSSRKSDV